MAAIELPTVGYFKNGNGWLGSVGPLRFQIERPDDAGSMTVVLWPGPFSRPYAPELGRETFPVSEEGRAALADFLVRRSQELQERPVFSPDELSAFYRAKKDQEQVEKAAE